MNANGASLENLAALSKVSRIIRGFGDEREDGLSEDLVAFLENVREAFFNAKAAAREHSQMLLASGRATDAAAMFQKI